MNETLLHRGPDSGGVLTSTAARHRGPAAGDHRPRDGRPAASPTRTARSPSCRTARSTTTASCAPSSSARATRSARRATPRSSRTSTRSAGRASQRTCAGCSRSRSGTPSAGASCSLATASGSSRSTTGTTADSLSFASELKALLAQPASRARSTRRPSRRSSHSASCPAPLSIFREVRKLPPGEHARLGRGPARARSTIERYAKPRPAPPRACAARARRSSPRSCSIGCATRSAPT